MSNSIPYGARSTADQVLAGIDLHKKCILVTGCNSGIGFETMKALAANGTHVIGLSRSFTASPRVTGITGEYWADCQIARGSPLLNDRDLAKRLWNLSAQMVTRQNPSQSKSMQLAA